MYNAKTDLAAEQSFLQRRVYSTKLDCFEKSFAIKAFSLSKTDTTALISEKFSMNGRLATSVRDFIRKVCTKIKIAKYTFSLSVR